MTDSKVEATAYDGDNPGPLESLLMCMHEWHEPNQEVDDFHHCTRPAEHTGPHMCGWCQDLSRGPYAPADREGDQP